MANGHFLTRRGLFAASGVAALGLGRVRPANAAPDAPPSAELVKAAQARRNAHLLPQFRYRCDGEMDGRLHQGIRRADQEHAPAELSAL